MDIKVHTDELIPCMCGYKPDHYSISYGRTPYHVFCPICKKQTNDYKSVGDAPSNIINLWNNICANKTKEELIEMRRKEDKIAHQLYLDNHY